MLTKSFMKLQMSFPIKVRMKYRITPAIKTVIPYKAKIPE